MINRNMGCIEIIFAHIQNWLNRRLIETWDVLKYIFIDLLKILGIRLIETWDVLKSGTA